MQMNDQLKHSALDYDAFMEVVRRRRSVRKFEHGREVDRELLLRIAEAGRWAPTGANTQCWDLIVVHDPAMRAKVFDVFLRQAKRLVAHAKGFPAVNKTYLEDAVAIFIVVADPRWKVCFPQGTSPDWVEEYDDNNEKIFLASIGAVVQNLQLATTAVGLTSAWLSGGGEATTNRELSELLGYPENMQAVGTMPVGYPRKDAGLRYRRPIEQVVHWDRYQPEQFRPQPMIDYYEANLRPFAMYRGDENMADWEDAEEKAGEWLEAFTGSHPNPGGKLPE
jgi:nitroreductase